MFVKSCFFVSPNNKDYRFCGYGEALGGDERAREGLLELALGNAPVQSQEEALAIYRKHLYASDKKKEGHTMPFPMHFSGTYHFF